MSKKKIQKVKFHKGDRRPRHDKEYPNLTYRKRMIKKGDDIVWHVTEYPTKSIISEHFFEEDAQKLVQFQNKHKVWQPNGGVPRFLCYKYNRDNA